jgi:hypothetical protein
MREAPALASMLFSVTCFLSHMCDSLLCRPAALTSHACPSCVAVRSVRQARHAGCRRAGKSGTAEGGAVGAGCGGCCTVEDATRGVLRRCAANCGQERAQQHRAKVQELETNNTHAAGEAPEPTWNEPIVNAGICVSTLARMLAADCIQVIFVSCSPLRQAPLMGPQPPVELQVTLGTPAYPSSHRARHTLLIALVGEQLNDP